MWKDLQITNRLLYQLSYVGLPSILNGRPESVKLEMRRCRNATAFMLRTELCAAPRGMDRCGAASLLRPRARQLGSRIPAATGRVAGPTRCTRRSQSRTGY